MKSSENTERESNDAYILFNKDNCNILNNTIINKLQDSFKLMLKKIDNHQLSINNLYVTGDLAFWLYY